jgi:cytidylate kinase
MIVTIDGPAGSGKSTAARTLATQLGYRFLDTGAMYRSFALACLEQKISLEDVPTVAKVCAASNLEMKDGAFFLNGNDVSQAIRTPEVTHAASIVAAYPEVRCLIVPIQRKIASAKNIVAEGRDQGTVVFPDAECKFFLTASIEARAQRRYQEQIEKGQTTSLAELQQKISDRDGRDQNREHSPLFPAEDAMQIDTTNHSIEEVLELMEKKIAEVRAASEQ